MKLAMFAKPGQSPTVLHEPFEYWSSCGYVQQSEIIEVEFPPLPREVLVDSELKMIHELRAATVEEFTKKLNALDNRKAELLALTLEAEPA